MTHKPTGFGLRLFMTPHNPSPVCRGSCVSPSRRAILNLRTGGDRRRGHDCAGPPVLEHQVLGYDEVTKTLDDELPRLQHRLMRQLTSKPFTSRQHRALLPRSTGQLHSVSAVRSSGRLVPIYSTSILVGARQRTPTFSISPLSGEEFTKRIATSSRRATSSLSRKGRDRPGHAS